MRILVTGAAGFVGSTLINTLAEAGHEVMGLYRNTRPSADGCITLIKHDLAHPLNSLPQVDVIIHTAVQNLHQTATVARDFINTNVVGAINLANYAERVGARFLLNFSSVSVYGMVKTGLLEETTPLTTPELYGASKYMAELIFQEKAVPLLSIRLPGIVGPGTFSPWLGKVCKSALEGLDIGIFCPDAPFNNIVSVQELSRFTNFCLTRQWQGTQMVNFGASQPSTIRGVAEAIIATTRSSSQIVVKDSPSTPFSISTNRLEALGFTPAGTLDQVTRYAKSCLSYSK